MSVSKRLISGTVASWVQISVNLVTQLALVPLYLTYWKVETYGLWLAILSFGTVINSLDLGHQEYLGYEFFRIGKADITILSKYLSSGIFIAVILGITEVAVMMLLVAFNVLPYVFGDSLSGVKAANLHDAGIVLVLFFTSSLLGGSVEGLLSRMLCAFGYFPRTAWWGVFSLLIANITPAVAVVFGAGLLKTGIITVIVKVLSEIPIYWDMIRLLKKEKITFSSPSFKLGFQNFIHASVISLTSLFENLRHQGARIFLKPLAGSVGLAAFATMRTGANVAMQGLHTITTPLMPELMRFLHQRDRVRINVAFGTVWIVTVAIMAPTLVLLQAFVGPIYTAWTRGQLQFNPSLFAILSLNILIYAISQPAISVVRGNNLLKPMVLISSITAAVVVIGMFVLVPLMGILGAGIALFISEVVANIAFRIVAKQWLAKSRLAWPTKSYNIALTSVWIAALTMGSMILYPNQQGIILPISMSFLFYNFWRYWQALPLLATDRVKHLIANVQFFKMLFSK